MHVKMLPLLLFHLRGGAVTGSFFSTFAVLAVTVCQLASTVMDASWPTWRVYKVVGARTGFMQALW